MSYSKYLYSIYVGLLLMLLEQTGAASLTHPEDNYTHPPNKSNNLSCPSTQQTLKDVHNSKLPAWYIKMGIGEADLATPDFSYGAVNQLTKEYKFRFHTQKLAYQPQITLGHKFQNNKFMPLLFGDTLKIAASINTLRTNTNDFIPNPGIAFLWKIDGSGAINLLDAPFINARFNAKQRFTTAAITASGNKFIDSNQRISSSLSLGIAFRDLSQNYFFSAEGDAPQPIPHSLYENAGTHYYGLLLGDQLNWKLNDYWQPFISANVAMLHVETNFNGTQITSVPGSDVAIQAVNNETHKNTYETDFALGFKVKPKANLFFTVKLGATYFAYLPEVVNPLGANTEPAHVDGIGAWNRYANLSVTLPF